MSEDYLLYNLHRRIKKVNVVSIIAHGNFLGDLRVGDYPELFFIFAIAQISS